MIDHAILSTLTRAKDSDLAVLYDLMLAELNALRAVMISLPPSRGIEAGEEAEGTGAD